MLFVRIERMNRRRSPVEKTPLPVVDFVSHVVVLNSHTERPIGSPHGSQECRQKDTQLCEVFIAHRKQFQGIWNVNSVVRERGVANSDDAIFDLSFNTTAPPVRADQSQ